MGGDHARSTSDKSHVRRAMRELISEDSELAVREEPSLFPAHAVLIYLPMPGELDISPIARKAWRAGKIVAAPRLNRADRSITPVRIRNFDADLVPVQGIRGLREPRLGLEEVPVDNLDLVLVPGLAFDRLGHRLGRGAGYYDRFLPRLSAHTKVVGVCHDHQIIDRVPTEPHDVRVHAILTPTTYLLVE